MTKTDFNYVMDVSFLLHLKYLYDPYVVDKNGPLERKFYLHFNNIAYSITEPTTEIIGGPDLYIDRGSTINLTCVVLYSPEPPAYIFWNHNDAVRFYKKKMF